MKNETIAVFDFDGTITKKDTLLEFIKFSKGKMLFFISFFIFTPLLVFMKLGLLPNYKVKQKLFSFLYKGTSLENFNKHGEDFSKIIDKIIFPEAIEKINSHKKNGDKIVIISASIENWIKPWADKIGVTVVLATKIEIDKYGLLNGKFLTKNCYGQEKVNRFLEIFPNRTDYKLIVYGNSRGDKEIINLADEKFFRKFK